MNFLRFRGPLQMFGCTGAPEGRVCTAGAGSAVLAGASVATSASRRCCTGLRGLILPPGFDALVSAQATGAGDPPAATDGLANCILPPGFDARLCAVRGVCDGASFHVAFRSISSVRRCLPIGYIFLLHAWAFVMPGESFVLSLLALAAPRVRAGVYMRNVCLLCEYAVSRFRVDRRWRNRRAPYISFVLGVNTRAEGAAHYTRRHVHARVVPPCPHHRPLALGKGAKLTELPRAQVHPPARISTRSPGVRCKTHRAFTRAHISTGRQLQT